jgi:hypothetical protein
MKGDRIDWACMGAPPVDDRAGPVPASHEVVPSMAEERGAD